MQTRMNDVSRVVVIGGSAVAMGLAVGLSCTEEHGGSCPLKFNLFNSILLQSWGEAASQEGYFCPVLHQRTLD